jgi:hypothetical protein
LLKIKIKTKRKTLPLTQPAIHLTKPTPPLLFSHPHSIEEEKTKKKKTENHFSPSHSWVQQPQE